MTIQLKLPTELENRLHEAARKSGLTPADLTLKLLDQHLPSPERRASFIALLEQWQAEDEAMTDEEIAANEVVLRAIDEDRLSNRKLFSELDGDGA